MILHVFVAAGVRQVLVADERQGVAVFQSGKELGRNIILHAQACIEPGTPFVIAGIFPHGRGRLHAGLHHTPPHGQVYAPVVPRV